ncbi:rRNA maturation RNase YbeY [Bacteroidota bacterium]
MAINFHENNVISGLKKKRVVKAWLHGILAAENKIAGQINIIFTTDRQLHEINMQYLSKDYYTDIITFDYSEGSSISGDIFISIERIEENAREFSVAKEKELMRVMAHGFLHLLGYDDSTEKEKKSMRRMEDKCLESSPVIQ